MESAFFSSQIWRCLIMSPTPSLHIRCQPPPSFSARYFIVCQPRSAKEAMFHYTDTPYAPWTVVKSNEKKRARLEAMRHVLSLQDYANKDLELVGNPKILGPAAQVLEHGESATHVFPTL